MTLFENDGFEETTIADIADAAGISARTFYAYFDSKDDLVLADYSARLDRIIDHLDNRPSDESPWSAVRSAFEAVSRDYEEHSDWLLRRLRIMATTPSVFVRNLELQAGWESTLSVHLAQRMDAHSDDLEPRLLAATALAAMRSSMQQWLAGSRDVALPNLVLEAFDRLGRGLDRP